MCVLANVYVCSRMDVYDCARFVYDCACLCVHVRMCVHACMFVCDCVLLCMFVYACVCLCMIAQVCVRL